ncbi:MAG: Lrp/AsnC family transcriptional regulator [Neisseriaceae bacterium]|nr:Lrp/AsnC family transcriptional regulator [Neisseriaceae bacterium]MBQ9620049.1 Lrp/AsnC family transcriptional regulator [Neisseriaceae bacterium]
MEFDKTDLRILNALQQNGRLSNVELADRVALSPSPCLRRLKQLEDAGVIERYAALLSPKQVGLGIEVFINVTLAKNREIRSAFELAVRDWDEVLSCLALTGETDYLLHAYFVDMNDFSHFVLDVLLSRTGVLDAKSSFVLKNIKKSTSLPLKHVLEY